jgi:SpoVK/Ycf46/Vps4 family AAA+-type ATPase
LKAVAAAAQGFSGAEIDALVQTALYAAFAHNTDLNTQMLVDAVKGTVPLSTTRAEDIAALRAWAVQRAVPAAVLEKLGQSAG